jgi:hypothetical protein
MTEPNDTTTVIMIFSRIILGLIAGIVVSAIICYVQPKMFASRVLLAADERPGRTVALAPIHAAQVIRLTGDEIEWAEPPAELIAKIRKHTRITAVKDGVEITVTRTNKLDARTIAEELAWLFRGMDDEEHFAKNAADLPPLTDDDRQMMLRRRSVEQLMREEALQGINNWNFRMVPALARMGSTEAQSLWRSESFQRHWDFHQMATAQISCSTRTRPPVREMLLPPEISDIASSPQVELYLMIGSLSGIALGSLLGIRRSRRLETLRTEDRKSEESRANSRDGARIQPPPLNPPPRRVSPEEEW